MKYYTGSQTVPLFKYCLRVNGNIVFYIIPLQKFYSLKSKNSSGYDKILKNIIKLCGEYLGGPFVHIYYRSVNLGKFPDRFKYSVVNPLYQSHEKSLLCNYRPIS